MKPMRRILCPVDFSETSAKAFAYADELAAALGTTIVLAHAFDMPKKLDMSGQNNPADESLRERLQAMASSAHSEHVQQVLHAGDPGEVICWLAQECDCDLIVMGTHGRTGLAHLLFGSTAEHVLRHARCPVLGMRNRPAGEPDLKEPLVLPRKAPRLM